MSRIEGFGRLLPVLVATLVLGFTSSADSTEHDPEKTEADTVAELSAEDIYPSAKTCAACHPKQYSEWSVSQHAYAQLSPVYMAFQMAVNGLTSSTNGDFCIRCHNPIGMNMGESLFVSNLERPASSREGITCSVCHRVGRNYGKVSGRLSLVRGPMHTTVFGPTGSDELKRVIADPDEQGFRVVTDPLERGLLIHPGAEEFPALSKPGFCGTCHDVTLLNGFRLEEAFSEYKQTDAAAAGVTCQDCHMGKVPGVASGYETGPAAIVNGIPTTPRKLTNHFFAGPDYSLIHPGIFPHNVEAAELADLRSWLKFDYRAGWGTEEFEEQAEDDESIEFPEEWSDALDREEAREVLDVQFERLDWAREQRLAILRSGYKLDDIVVESAGPEGIDFSVNVRNGTNGHAVPTGFDAERLVYLEVTVTDSAGEVVYVSGDRDPNGDVRDYHSKYVHNGELPVDEDLFSLQSKFIVRLFRGGEREQVLAINKSLSPQPFIRPETRPTVLYGRPRGARKHKLTIEPLGSRTASYSISGDKLVGASQFSVRVRLIAQSIPINLIFDIQGVGFDYGMNPKEIADRVLEGSEILWERSVTVDF